MFAKLALISFSLAISVSLVEGLSRLVLNPMDLLQPTMEHDPNLNHRIAPGTGGHDEKGFRNDSVPDQAKIVAIGDSMTYGVAATADNSWPRALQELSNVEVYNMALGGYGPLHYEYLVQTQAFELAPETIVVGLYLGNDLMDAYNLVYSNDVWSHHRQEKTSSKVDATNLVEYTPSEDKFLGGLRNFLSRHSVLYAVLTRSFVGDLVRYRESNIDGGNLASVNAPEGETFVNVGNFVAGLNLDDDRLLEGLSLALGSLERINMLCKERSVRLLVAVIPTKARVYWDNVVPVSPDLIRYDQILKTLENEDHIRSEITAFLERSDIDFVDLLPALQAHARTENIYPANDGHPNSAGYSTIAQQIHLLLQSRT
ncbi:MAG: hypothetical protein NXH95_00325 [Pseudomonadaceae bacterium]|nr:hypothetical protein [Pseudomonadaceae bacterium]